MEDGSTCKCSNNLLMIHTDPAVGVTIVWQVHIPLSNPWTMGEDTAELEVLSQLECNKDHQTIPGLVDVFHDCIMIQNSTDPQLERTLIICSPERMAVPHF